MQSNHPLHLDLYKQGVFPFDKLIKYYTLDTINEAVADSKKGTTLKEIMKFSS